MSGSPSRRLTPSQRSPPPPPSSSSSSSSRTGPNWNLLESGLGTVFGGGDRARRHGGRQYRPLFDDDDAGAGTNNNETDTRIPMPDADSDDHDDHNDDDDDDDDDVFGASRARSPSVLSDTIDNGDDRHRSAAAAAAGDADLYVRTECDLDTFLTRVYEYYVHGGMWPYGISKLGYVLKLLFTGALVFFLLGGVDYAAMWAALGSTERGDETLPQHVRLGDFVYFVGLSWWGWILALAFAAYSAIVTVRTARSVHAMATVRDFYRYVLKVRHLGTIEWGEVVERLARTDELRRRAAAEGARLPTELDIVNRIMRRDNYLVALVNLDVLALPRDERTCMTEAWNPLFVRSAPSGSTEPHAQRDDDAYYYNRHTERPVHPVLTKTLEWALHRGLFSFAFDPHTAALRPELARMASGQRNDDVLRSLAEALAARHRTLALIGVLLSPFVLVYLVTDFLLEHGESVRNRPQNAFGIRNWSNEARWLFRDFNELPHYFRRRLARAYEPASRYTSNFSSPSTSVAARLAAYCVGALVGVLLAFGLFWDDDALTRVDFAFGRSGLWWIGVLGALLALARALLPADNVVFDPRAHLRAVARHTHYMPRSWLGREHAAVVRQDFFRLFEFRWWLYFRELLSVVYTPYLLYCVLPERTEAMLRFLVDNTVHLDGVGYVCRYAAFELRRDGDPLYCRGEHHHSRSTAAETVAAAASAAAAVGHDSVATMPAYYPARHGKLESSYVNFCARYRHWQPPEENNTDHDNACNRVGGARGGDGDDDGGGGDGDDVFAAERRSFPSPGPVGRAAAVRMPRAASSLCLHDDELGNLGSEDGESAADRWVADAVSHVVFDPKK